MHPAGRRLVICCTQRKPCISVVNLRRIGIYLIGAEFRLLCFTRLIVHGYPYIVIFFFGKTYNGFPCIRGGRRRRRTQSCRCFSSMVGSTARLCTYFVHHFFYSGAFYSRRRPGVCITGYISILRRSFECIGIKRKWL